MRDVESFMTRVSAPGRGFVGFALRSLMEVTGAVLTCRTARAGDGLSHEWLHPLCGAGAAANRMTWQNGPE